MNEEPVAWGMFVDGNFYDCISPEEHNRHEGKYTTPLYTHPAKTLTDEEILELAKEQYGHAVGLYNHIGFAKAILKKATEK